MCCTWSRIATVLAGIAELRLHEFPRSVVGSCSVGRPFCCSLASFRLELWGSSSCVASLIMVAEYKREIPAAMQKVKLVFIQRTGASLQHQLNMSLAINASAEVHLFMSELIPYQSHRFFLTRSWKDHEHHLILQRTGGYIGLQTNCFIRLNLNRKWTKETLLSTRGRKTVWKYLIRQWRLVDVL